jgi:hypothetical protein
MLDVNSTGRALYICELLLYYTYRKDYPQYLLISYPSGSFYRSGVSPVLVLCIFGTFIYSGPRQAAIMWKSSTPLFLLPARLGILAVLRLRVRTFVGFVSLLSPRQTMFYLHFSCPSRYPTQ